MADAKRPRPGSEEPDDEESLALRTALEETQNELDKVNEEASDKVLAVEMEYSKKRRPIYKKRNRLLAQLPEFWKTVFTNHPLLSSILFDDDLAILGYCTEVDIEDSDDIKSGFSITMRFEPNPYFEDEELVKHVKYDENGQLSGEAPRPRWKPGMAPGSTQPSGGKRPRDTFNFFNWWTTVGPGGEDGRDEIADLIKDDIFPTPLKYYAGSGADDEDGAGLMYGGDDDGGGEGFPAGEGEEDEGAYSSGGEDSDFGGEEQPMRGGGEDSDIGGEEEQEEELEEEEEQEEEQ